MSWRQTAGVSKICVRENKRGAYIGPRHEIVRCLTKVADGGVIHNLVRNVKVVCVLDERPARLAATA